MRKISAGIVVASTFLLCGSLSHAQVNEFSVGGSMISSIGVGYEAPLFGANISGQIHIRFLDVGGEFTRSNFPKTGTTGGSRHVTRGYLTGWFSKNLYVGTDFTHLYGNATPWTKTVGLIGGYAGIRLIGGRRTRPEKILLGSNGIYRKIRDVKLGRKQIWVQVSYRVEIKTNAIVPNNTNFISASLMYDIPIDENQALRLDATYSFLSFNQTVLGSLERLHGKSVTLSFSYRLRAREF